MKDLKALIVGCGFSGAAAARSLAENGYSVTILEKRGHIAGNMYDCKDSNGVLIHRYGPHIFHTSDKSVFDFLSRFTKFIPYEHTVLGRIDGQLVPIPFNFKSMDILFGSEKAEEYKKALKADFGDRERVSVSELLTKTGKVKELGEYVFEKVFLHYTAKQWGMPADKVDRSVISRVPVVLGYDCRYFSDTYQYMPEDGFTKLFERMLDHPKITVETGVDALKLITTDEKNSSLLYNGKTFDGPVIWTAPADELFGFCFGHLPYRSLDLHFEPLNIDKFQPGAVVNYPNEEDFTRITEFKYLTGQKVDGATTILKEYPLLYSPESEKGNVPYYPIINPENLALINKYDELAKVYGNLYFCGRLAQYKYFNMDAAVASALSLADKIINK